GKNNLYAAFISHIFRSKFVCMGKGGFQTLHNILDTDSIVGNILFRFENPMDFFYINWRPIIINPYRNFAILQDRSVDMDPAVSLQTVKNSVFYKRLKQKPRAFCLQHWSRHGIFYIKIKVVL